jgi:hypothetical protein
MDMPVALLITVDAADGPFTDKVDRSIPSNVNTNIIYYQSTPYGGSRGYENYPAPGNNSTHIYNQYYYGDAVNHKSIDELTSAKAVYWINYFLNH